MSKDIESVTTNESYQSGNSSKYFQQQYNQFNNESDSNECEYENWSSSKSDDDIIEQRYKSNRSNHLRLTKRHSSQESETAATIQVPEDNYDVVNEDGDDPQYFLEIRNFIKKISDDIDYVKRLKSLIDLNSKVLRGYSNSLGKLLKKIQELHIESNKLMTKLLENRRLVISQVLRQLIRAYRLFYSVIYLIGYIKKFYPNSLTSIKGEFISADIAIQGDLKHFLDVLSQQFMMHQIAISNFVRPAKECLSMDSKVQLQEYIRLSISTELANLDVQKMDNQLNFYEMDDQSKTMDTLCQMDIFYQDIVDGNVFHLLKFGTLVKDPVTATLVLKSSRTLLCYIFAFTDCFFICQITNKKKRPITVEMILPYQVIIPKIIGETKIEISPNNDKYSIAINFEDITLEIASNSEVLSILEAYNDYMFPPALKSNDYPINHLEARQVTVDIGLECDLCQLALCEPQYHAICIDDQYFHQECALLAMKKIQLYSFYMSDKEKAVVDVISPQTPVNKLKYLESLVLAYEKGENIRCENKRVDKSGESDKFIGEVPAKYMTKINFKYGGAKIETNFPEKIEYPELKLYLSDGIRKDAKKGKKIVKGLNIAKQASIGKRASNKFDLDMIKKISPQIELLMWNDKNEMKRIIQYNFDSISFRGQKLTFSYQNSIFEEKCDFFYGDITRSETTRLLSDSQPSTFLMRSSKNTDGTSKLVISVKNEKELEMHWRISFIFNKTENKKIILWFFDEILFFDFQSLFRHFCINAISKEVSNSFVFLRYPLVRKSAKDTE